MRYLSVLSIFFVLVAFPLRADSDLFFRIFQQHIKLLSHLEEPNPPQLICISGTPGMGKTYVAKRLEAHFKAIRLSSDEARVLFKANGVPLEWINLYISYCLLELPKISPNQTVILDRSCDRTYEQYELFGKRYGYKNFLIRLVASRDIVEKRIIARGDNVEQFLKDMDRYWKDYENFGRNSAFDFILDNCGENDNIPRLIDVIERTRTFQHVSPGSPEYERLRAEIIYYAEKGVPQEDIAHDGCSEIIPGLYIGNQVFADVIASKTPPFISQILTLRTTPKDPQRDAIRWKGIAVEDTFSANILDFFEQTFPFIEQTRSGILIHCARGCSRSPAFTIAYLMKKFELPFSTAYAYVRKKRPRTNPNPGFMQQLFLYEKQLHTCPAVL